jgi:FAD/FMN-containing dehydrogenase
MVSEVSTGTALGEATVAELRQSVRGEILQPGDTGYEQARLVWNRMIDRRPALIVRCTGVADVIAAVRFARSNDLLVAVRGGGHNAAGFATCDGGIVIDCSPMKGVRVGPVARTAVAQAGLTWGELDHETQAFGLATTGGLVSTTGVAGFTLGGGIGWLMRKHGMAVDNLIGADLVTADGELVRASETENAELLWALRGGGGNFGVVTAFTFRLHPVGPTVYGGPIFFPYERAAELLRFYEQWTRTLADELTTLFAIAIAPPEPFIPEPLHGAPVALVFLCYAGPEQAGEAAIRPLREAMPPIADLAGPMPYTALQSIGDAGAPAGIRAYFRSLYVDELSDGAIETLLRQCDELRSLHPFSTLHIHHLEGAVGRVAEDATASGRRNARYVLNVVGLWDEQTRDGEHVAWVRRTSEALQPFASSGSYLNFLTDEGEDRVRAVYGPAKYARLAALKARYDPTNLFRLNQNVKPAST